MEASLIELRDKDGTVVPEASPMIGGNNLFTGEYEGRGGSTGFNTDDPDTWSAFWANTVHEKPPGALPKGTTAFMIAGGSAEDPQAYVPKSIFLDFNEDGETAVTVHWSRVHLKLPDEPAPKSRYAVLLVPAGLRDIQFYSDVSLAEEKEKQAEAARRLAEAAGVFTEGSQKPVRIRPPMKFGPIKPGKGPL